MVSLSSDHGTIGLLAYLQLALIELMKTAVALHCPEKKNEVENLIPKQKEMWRKNLFAALLYLRDNFTNFP